MRLPPLSGEHLKVGHAHVLSWPALFVPYPKQNFKLLTISTANAAPRLIESDPKP